MNSREKEWHLCDNPVGLCELFPWGLLRDRQGYFLYLQEWVDRTGIFPAWRGPSWEMNYSHAIAFVDGESTRENAPNPVWELFKFSGVELGRRCQRKIHAEIIKDILYCPFRPLRLISPDGLCGCSCATPCPLGKVGSSTRCSSKELTDKADLFYHYWLTPDVTGMARSIYSKREFSHTPYLADALEEAGCTVENILRHLRGEQWGRCPDCLGDTGSYQYAPDDLSNQRLEGSQWYSCRTCNGLGLAWIKKEFPCVPGCAIIDVLLGKE